MPFTKMGIGGELAFDNRRALQSMGQARDSMGRFIKTADGGPASFGRFGLSFDKMAQKVRARAQALKAGMSQIGSGLRNATLAATPLTIGLVAGAKKAADFEKQMSAVGAITRATDSDFAALTAEAKRLGIVSAFSATQSAQGMEFLGRAGFETKDIIAALGGVMNAAAADGIDLATSADIVARSVKSMGLEASDAGHVADVLALASAKSNTSITALGESMTYGAAQAKSMGIPIESLVAMFGKVADAGLRGSIGGTSITNMLVKMSKPSKEAKRLMDKWRVSLTDLRTGELKPLPDIIDQFKKHIDKIPDAVEKARVQSEIFGIRGAKAYSALAQAGGKALRDLTAELKMSSFGIGAAAEMAEKRLDNLLGRLTLFASSVESVSIEFFSPLLKTLTPVVEDITSGLNNVLFAFQKLQQHRDAEATASTEMAKKEASAIAERLKLTKALGDEQGAMAQAGIATLTRMRIGEEDLSRAQREARVRSFTQFADLALQQKGISEKVRKARVADFEKMVQAATKRGASEKEIAAMQKRFNQLIGEAAKKEGKLGLTQRARLVSNLQLERAAMAQRAKIDAKAKAMIEREKLLANIEEEHGRTAMVIADGVLQAIDAIKSGINTAVEWVKKLGKRISDAIGEERLKQIAKIGTIFLVAAGAAVPLMAALGAVVFIVKAALIPVLAGVLAVIKAVFLPAVVIVGLLYLAYRSLRKENETLLQTATRVWGDIKAWALDVYYNALLPMWRGFKDAIIPIVEMLGQIWDRVWSEIKSVFNAVFGDLMQQMGDAEVNWYEVGQTIAVILGTVAAVAIEVFGGIVKAVIVAGRFIYEVFAGVLHGIDKFFKDTFDGILDIMEGNFLRGMGKLALGLIDLFLTPMYAIMRGIATLMEKLPLPDWAKKITTAMKDAAKYGYKGLVFPEKPEATKKAVKTTEKATAKVIDFKEAKKLHDFKIASGRAEERQLIKLLNMEGMKTKQQKKAAVAIAKERMMKYGETREEAVKVAASVIRQKTEERRAERLAKKQQKTEVKIEDKRQLEIKNRMCVNGREVATATSRTQQNILERSGATTPPYQRRISVEQGAPVRSTG